MKRLSFVFTATLMLVACANEEPVIDDAVPVESEEKKEMIEVTLDVEPVFDSGTVYFVGETNLPDHGVLRFTVNGPNDFTAETKEIVLDGEFQTDVFGAKGETLHTGVYDVLVSLSSSSTQEEEFVKAAGENYEHLSGNLMDDSGPDKTMTYETTFIID